MAERIPEATPLPVDSIVERLARAISVPEHHTTWDLLSERERDLYRHQAEYAVKVMAARIEQDAATIASLAARLDEATTTLNGISNALPLGPLDAVSTWRNLAHACQQTARVTLSNLNTGGIE